MDPKPSASERIFRFGIFEADPTAGHLLRNGSRVRVQPQPFRILIQLLERHGEVVTREELRTALWSRDTFVEFDDGLNAAIKKLRYALGESGERPTFIETIPRRGYRFIAPVVIGTAPSITAVPPRRRIPVAWLSAAAIVAVVASAGALIALKRQPLAAPDAAPIRSLVVLPLKNLSNDPEQQYFADGMTEELTTRLAELEGLRVISRTSAMTFISSRKPLPEIAAELKVDAVVDGSVLRSGDRIRITAQLIHAATDRHLWAGSFERDERDVLQLQNDVAQRIAEKISLKLRQGAAAAARGGPIHSDAYRAYLRGRHLWHTRRVENLIRAADDFNRAIAIEPQYGLAYAGLADVHLVVPLLSTAPREVEFAKAREAAQKALALNPSLAEAHNSIAYVNMWHDWDFAAAERHFRRSIELNPNYATAHQWYAELLSLQGRHNDAIGEIRIALELDPLAAVMHHQAGEIYQFARRYDEAIQEYKNAVAIDPSFDRYSGWAMAWAYTRKGVLGPEVEKWKTLRNARNEVAISELEHLAVSRNPAGFRAKRLELYRLELAKAWGSRMYYDAMLSAAAGLDEEALSFLETAYRQHDEMVLRIHVDPEWDHLRSDPKFKAIAAKVGAVLNVAS
jgi:TolB-like protein/DNA-binding winged helix-turn-helix (wHTH) protein/Tfp pilus assembly protein PilF